MKKLILITAMLALLSGCVTIDSKYTGRSRLRIYNDFNRGCCFYSSPIPIPYYGWIYVPYGYYGNVYFRNKSNLNKRDYVTTRGTISKRQLTAPTVVKKTSKTKIKKK
jgi:hypothetical protein